MKKKNVFVIQHNKGKKMNKILHLAITSALLSAGLANAADDGFVFGNNDLGDEVGVLVPSGHAFVRDKSGTVTDLGTLGGSGSRAYDINNHGQIVGESDTSRPGYTQHHATLWEDGKIIDLKTLGGHNSYATMIHDSGQIIGYSLVTGGGYYHATLWNGASAPIDLGTLNRPGTSIANDINIHGQVVGYADPNILAQEYHAVIWDGTKITDIGLLFEGRFMESQAGDINDNGYVVGYSSIDPNIVPSNSHGFLWHKDMGIIDQTSLLDPELIAQGWVVITGGVIDNNNLISTIAYNTNTHKEMNIQLQVPVSPVPEPTTWAMLLAGLGLLGFVGRKSKLLNA